ncbi:hypothetical protein TR2A62_0929 [Thalassobium sp. R2A62]|nr:hypothetical protein TR2A62_0929 [Thalassobium sp. R2A62]
MKLVAFLYFRGAESWCYTVCRRRVAGCVLSWKGVSNNEVKSGLAAGWS